MPIKTYATDPETGRHLHVERLWTETHEVTGNEAIPVILSAWDAHGTFRATSRTSAGVETIVSPLDEGSLIITDIMVTSDRVNSGSITISFTDGTENIDIVSADTTDAPVTISMPIEGRFQGWKNARVDLTVVGNVTTTVVVGYVKMPEGLSYSQWDALR